ncbi:MAG: hypothetical protein AAF851_10380 [Myxococcota bacterium]
MKTWTFITGLLFSTTVLAAPPFAGDPDADAIGPRPEKRTWGIKQGKIEVGFLFEPGIPTTGEVMTITVVPEEVSGRGLAGRKRIEGADMVLTVTDPEGKEVGRYRLHAYPRARAKYATHFTPTREGIYALRLEGRTSSGTLDGRLEMPVDIWPLPERLQGSGATKVQTRTPLRGPITK